MTPNGSTSFISFNSGSSLNVGSGNDFTYSAWVNTATRSVPSSRCGRARTPTRSSTSWWAWTEPAPAPASDGDVRDDTGGGGGDVVAPSAFNTGVWHLVTVTRTGTTFRLYVDATSVGTPVTFRPGRSRPTCATSARGALGAGQLHDVDNELFLAATFDEFRASTTARDSTGSRPTTTTSRRRRRSSRATRPESGPVTARSRPTDHARRLALVRRGGVVRRHDRRLGDRLRGRHARLQRVPRGRRRAREGQRRPSCRRRGSRPARARAIRSSTRHRPSPDTSTGSRTSRSRWTAGGTAPSRRSRRRTARRSRCPVRSVRVFRPPAHPAPSRGARRERRRPGRRLRRRGRGRARFSCRPARAGGAGAGGSPSPGRRS